MKKFIKITLWILAAFIVAQLVPINRKNPPVDRNKNFTDIYKTPQNIQDIMRKSCYDCHSNETVYPKYAYVAPISWSVKHHVNKGREHLNFSVWGSYGKELKKGMLENSVADLQQGRMPIAGYLAQHPGARLTAAESKVLTEYLDNILKTNNY